MADKSIKFGFTVDQASVQATKLAIKGLVDDFTKLSQAMKNMGGGMSGGMSSGSTPGGTPTGMGSKGAGKEFAASIRENKQLLSSLGGASKEALQAMSSAVKQSMGAQKREIVELDRALNTLAKTYKELGKLKSGASPGMISSLSSQQEGISQALMSTSINRQQSWEKLESTRDVHDAIGARGGGGIVGMMRSMVNGAAGNSLQANPNVSAAAGGAQQAINLGVQQQTGMINNLAGAQDYQRYMGQNAMYGNVAPQLMGTLKTGNGTTVNDAVTGSGAATMSKASAYGGVVTGAVKSAANLQFGDALGGMASGVQDIYNFGPQAQTAKMMLAKQRGFEDQDPTKMGAIQTFETMAPEMVSAAKRNQGQHMRAWGVGGGYGLGFGESNAVASDLMNQYGRDGVIGSSSSSTSNINVPIAKAFSVPLQQRHKGMFKAFAEHQDKMDMIYGFNAKKAENDGRQDRIKALEAQGYTGTDGNMSKTTTTHHMGLMEGTLGMERMGIDRSAAGQILARMSSAQGGDKTAAPEQAYARLQDAMSKAMERGTEKGLKNGFNDAKVFETIGKEIADASITANGGKSTGMEYGRILSSGFDKDTNVFDAQQNVGAMRSMDSFTGGNSYMRAVSASAAVKALGGKGTGLQVGMLQNAKLSELLDGGESYDEMGISKDVRMNVLNGRMNALAAGRAGRGSKLERALKDSGGNFFKAMAGADKATRGETAQALLQGGAFESIDQAKAFVGMAGNIGNGTATSVPKSQTEFAKHSAGMAEAQVNNTEKIKMELSSIFVKTFGDTFGTALNKAFEDATKHIVQGIDTALAPKSSAKPTNNKPQ